MAYKAHNLLEYLKRGHLDQRCDSIGSERGDYNRPRLYSRLQAVPDASEAFDRWRSSRSMKQLECSRTMETFSWLWRESLDPRVVAPTACAIVQCSPMYGNVDNAVIVKCVDHFHMHVSTTCPFVCRTLCTVFAMFVHMKSCPHVRMSCARFLKEEFRMN